MITTPEPPNPPAVLEGVPLEPAPPPPLFAVPALAAAPDDLVAPFAPPPVPPVDA